MEGTANIKMVFQMSGWGALAFGLMSLSLEKAEVNGGDPACPHPHIHHHSGQFDSIVLPATENLPKTTLGNNCGAHPSI